MCGRRDPTRVKTGIPSLGDRIFEELGAEIVKYRTSIDSVEENSRGHSGV
jgi:hypothetical protein